MRLRTLLGITSFGYLAVAHSLMASVVGWTAAIMFTVGSMAVGFWLIVGEVLRVGGFLWDAVADWQWPARPAMLGYRLLGGLLLLLPGPLTQFPGWLVLFGPTRRVAIWLFDRVIARRTLNSTTQIVARITSQQSAAQRGRALPLA